MSLSVSCSKYFARITYLNPSFQMVYGIAYSGWLSQSGEECQELLEANPNLILYRCDPYHIKITTGIQRHFIFIEFTPH